MTNPLEDGLMQQDYKHPITPPPHLLKKFSEQAREDSQKRGHAGYCKTFAKLCIDWAFQEAAMDDLRNASAEASGVELNSKSSPNNLQIRSFDLDVTIVLVQQWTDEIYGGPGVVVGSGDICLAKLAAQYGADQVLDACCEWLDREGWSGESRQLHAARRPKPPSLKEQALARTAAILNDPSRALLIEVREALELNLRALEALLDD
jgi:hypothetical protein